MWRKLIVLEEATLNIEKVLHLNNEKREIQNKDLNTGNCRTLLSIATEVDTSEEKCGPDSKCRQNTNSRNHDKSAIKTLIVQPVGETANWFNTKRGYEFVARNETREDIFHQTVTAHPKHRGMRRNISSGKTIAFDVAMTKEAARPPTSPESTRTIA